MLLDPRFAKDPPLKLNVSAQKLGLVYAIFFSLVSLFAGVALLGLLGAGFSTGATRVDINVLRVIGTSIALIGLVAVVFGGYEMYRAKRAGKQRVVYGLLAALAGALISALGGGAGGLAGAPVNAAFFAAMYYLVIISRFPDDPPLVLPRDRSS